MSSDRPRTASNSLRSICELARFPCASLSLSGYYPICFSFIFNLSFLSTLPTFSFKQTLYQRSSTLLSPAFFKGLCLSDSLQVWSRCRQPLHSLPEAGLCVSCWTRFLELRRHRSIIFQHPLLLLKHKHILVPDPFMCSFYFFLLLFLEIFRIFLLSLIF